MAKDSKTIETLTHDDKRKLIPAVGEKIVDWVQLVKIGIPVPQQ